MKKVVICGFASVMLKNRGPDFDDNLKSAGFEIWTMNDWWNFLPWLKRPDRVFQIHCRADGTWEFPDVWRAGRERNGKDWRKKYNESGAKIVVVTDNGGLENQIFFPAEYIRKYGVNYFSSSCNYMVAMAVEEKYNVISIQDCAMFGSDEYQEQLPALIYAIREARISGADVICPFESVWANAGLDLNNLHPLPRKFPYGVMKDVYNLGYNLEDTNGQLCNNHAA
jgi:hypothetical protein